MSFQRPVFNSGGLWGKANQFVCNAWTDSAEAVSENAEGIRWSQQQLLRDNITERWLAKITAATAIAANRWEYEFEHATVNAARMGAILSNAIGKGTGAINIRELTNTVLLVDNSAIPPGATIGPVGSVYAAGWPLAPLNAYVEMVLSYDEDGGLLYWFDAPNPVECGE